MGHKGNYENDLTRRFTADQVAGKSEKELTKMKQNATRVIDDPVYCDNCGIQISELEGDNMEAQLCIGCDHY